jgi:hypothetical protein
VRQRGATLGQDAMAWDRSRTLAVEWHSMAWGQGLAAVWHWFHPLLIVSCPSGDSQIHLLLIGDACETHFFQLVQGLVLHLADPILGQRVHVSLFSANVRQPRG